jgi:hypothetical protein
LLYALGVEFLILSMNPQLMVAGLHQGTRTKHQAQKSVEWRYSLLLPSTRQATQKSSFHHPYHGAVVNFLIFTGGRCVAVVAAACWLQAFTASKQQLLHPLSSLCSLHCG